VHAKGGCGWRNKGGVWGCACGHAWREGRGEYGRVVAWVVWCGAWGQAHLNIAILEMKGEAIEVVLQPFEHGLLVGLALTVRIASLLPLQTQARRRGTLSLLTIHPTTPYSSARFQAPIYTKNSKQASQLLLLLLLLDFGFVDRCCLYLVSEHKHTHSANYPYAYLSPLNCICLSPSPTPPAYPPSPLSHTQSHPPPLLIPTYLRYHLLFSMRASPCPKKPLWHMHITACPPFH
jgi:hypothetical protein